MFDYAQNIAHHEARAESWVAAGRPDYAAGSLRKAAKWRRRAREADQMFNGAFPKDRLGLLLDEKLAVVQRRMAADFEAVLYG